MKMVRFCVALLCCFLHAFTLMAQDSISMDTRVSNTYFYKIDNKQAFKIFKNPDHVPDTLYYRYQVYTQPANTDSLVLEQGNYLSVDFRNNKMRYKYLPVTRWRIFILSASENHLRLQIQDAKTGKPINVSNVKYGHNRLKYDPKTQIYTVKNCDNNNILAITDKGTIFYYFISRESNNYTSSLQWKCNSILRKIPLRYLSDIYKLYNRCLIDAALLLQKTPYRETSFAMPAALASDVYKTFQASPKNKDYSTYVYFNKPKYKENDTIKFKTHILKNPKKGKWYDKPVKVYLDEDDADICLGTAYSPKRGAGYDFQFVILDSMDINLDNEYEITFRDLDSNKLGSDKFTYEDYELKKSVFEIKLDERGVQYKGKPFSVHFTAKDENGLPVSDARASVVVTSRSATSIASKYLFLPDTLWTYAFNLKGVEDSLIIPDSIFPAADVDYSIKAVMQNSENERTDLDRWVSYRAEEHQIKMEADEDVLRITSNIPEDKMLHLTAEDRFEFNLLDTMVKIPCTLPLNNFAARYSGNIAGNYQKLELENIASEIVVNANRSKDSVFFSVDNPRQLPAVYFLYSHSAIIKKGILSDLPPAIAADAGDNCYLMVQYIWAGKTKTDNIYIPNVIHKATLTIEKPDVITPGKEVDIKITATDYHGKPIKNMSLLAYSYTQKFGDVDIAPPPYSGVISKNTYLPNSFDFPKENESNSALLSYNFWNNKFNLDTSWAYRFRYPSKTKPEFTHIKVDDSITQVAPFIMSNGDCEPVKYVYIDNVPVYFGFTKKTTPYSFEVDTNYHNIVIRTYDKLITLESIKVPPFVKTLFSIDLYNPPAFVKVKDTTSFIFSKRELRDISKFIMNINLPVYRYKYAYLEETQNYKQYIDLSIATYDRYKDYSISAGPIYWRDWNFNSFNNFQRSFEFEPNYTYTFDEHLVKMTSSDVVDPLIGMYGNATPSINDRVLTRKRLFEKYHNDINEERTNNYPPINGRAFDGRAKLTIDYDKSLAAFQPINIILGKPGDFNFIIICPGRTKEFIGLKPGNYQLWLVKDSGSFIRSGVIDVKDNGKNYYRFTKADSFITTYSDVIDNTLTHLYQSNNLDADIDICTLMSAYTDLSYTGKTESFSGIVLDADSNPIPNVLVRISKTKLGVITNKKGAFTIKIPASARQQLVVSGEGWTSDTIAATKDMRIQLTGSNLLKTVVVTSPYSAPITKGKYVGAADIVTSRSITHKVSTADITPALEGAAPGVQVTRSTTLGLVPGVQIRGRGSLSASTSPLYVIDGAPYDGDITTLDPKLIESMTVLKDAMSTSLYGARGANGVVVIKTKKGAQLPDKIKAGLEPPMTEDLMVSSLRNNFRDDAYWQPDLVTDENGKASFKVKFPDDITNWRTFLFAVDNQKHSGTSISNIKSYKPVSASLFMPHFLLAGDTAMLVGKSVNYIPDTVAATTSFFRNDSLQNEHKIKLRSFYNDTLMVTTQTTDSLKLKYLITKADGYFDGEEKTIPVKPVGVSVAEGAFMTLDMPDTNFIIYPTKKTDTLHINATASLIDVVMDEINVVRDYGYLCNEQMASKVIAMLTKETIYNALHKKMSAKDKNYVQDLMRKLATNQNNRQLWGWWNDGPTVPWISTHVMHALMQGKAMGYNCNVDFKPVMDQYVFDLEHDTTHTNVDMLQLLHENKMVINYDKYISRLERRKDLSLNDYLQLILLRQKLHLPYKTNKLKDLQQSDIYGNIYWKDTAQYVYENQVINTINALKIIEQDSTIAINKNKIINWLLQQRGNQGWRNTYESAKIIEAITAFIPLNDTAALHPLLHLAGGMEEDVTTFPYQKKIMVNTAVQVQKKGVAPVYFTYYFNKWDTTNTHLGDAFKIASSFTTNNKNVSYLPAGQPVTMNVHVDADKSADFVMIEIPIPAGCSYQAKYQSSANYEIHREYFEDKVSIFCEKLPKGQYNFQVELLPRYQGNYTINPAKAELMYFPVFYGREKIKKVEVR